MADLDSSTESRLEDLEVMTAHQARTIEDLSEELTKAFETIRQIQRRVEQLSERVGAVEDVAGNRPGQEKPPHY